MKFLVGIDDALDLFAEHAIGGMVGLFCNGLFGSTDIIALDGVNTAIPGGWLDRNWKQLYMQVAYIVAVTAYTFVVTAALAKALDLVGLRLRITPEDERLGMDEVEVGIASSRLYYFEADFCRRSVNLRMTTSRSDATTRTGCDLLTRLKQRSRP